MAFEKNRSTVNAITELVCHITNAFENKQNTLSVFLDLSKAFDIIDNNILLHKLECYGVRGLALNWFQSYLTDRKQYVLYNNVQSQTLGITCGVPQGSVLGPLLFLIYVNDIANCLTHSKLIYFADDTTVFLSSKCINDVYKNMNSDLDDLTNWFKANRLALNVNKSNSDTPQFRGGNLYFFSENLSQSVSFIYASMYSENVHAIHIAMQFTKNRDIDFV